ncbi:MAG: dTDP-4-dehydrorhamnose reductase [Patescibacteria group bacterium]
MVLVLGSKGMLGSELVRQLKAKNIEVAGFDSDLDVTNKEALSAKILELKPEVIYNCVAYNAVDLAEQEKEKAKALNSQAVLNIVESAEKVGATLVHFSTGFVFDGESIKSYKETDQPNPQSVYAMTKYQGEQNANKCSKHYIVRLNLLFGKSAESQNAKKSFPELVLELAKTQKEFAFVTDEISTPTYAVDLTKAVLELVDKKYPYGIYHLPNEGQASWLDFAEEVFRIQGMEVKLNPVLADKFVRAAKRPKNSVIANTKFPKLRPWQEALKEFLNSIKEKQ